jgi:glycogen(starch) synthase
MKILMIGWGFPPKIQGGLDVHVFEIAKELSKNNRVYLTLPQFNSPRKGSNGVNVIPIKCPEFSGMKSLINSVKTYNANIAKACRNLDFDIVHAHDWFGAEAAESLGKPWVFSMHSLEYMRSGHSGKSTMEALERRGAKKAGRIITVSRRMGEDISKRYGIRPEKIDVVYNSACIDKGNPERIRKKLGLGRSPIALFLGRLSGQKGPEYFLHAAKLALKEVPEAKFLMVGEGNLEKSLQQFSHHLGLDGNVIFTGFVPQNQLASYYAAADVYSLPSLHEPFGITALESLLSGTPVIVSENAGMLENIPEMDCVRTVRPASSQELAKTMISVLRSPRRVSEKEKAVLRKAYSWERAAKETLKAYQKVM